MMGWFLKRYTQKIESEHFPNFPQRYPLTKILFFTNFGNFRRFCEGTTEHTIRALWSGCERIQLLNTFSTSICFIPGVKSVLSVSKSNVLRRKTQCFVFCLKINYSPRCLDKLFSNFFERISFVKHDFVHRFAPVETETLL